MTITLTQTELSVISDIIQVQFLWFLLDAQFLSYTHHKNGGTSGIYVGATSGFALTC